MREEFVNAVRDSLTGLYTRDILKPLFATLSRAGNFSLFMLDIDNFKLVNDCSGHKRGDQVIVGMAKFLKEKAKKGYVIRMGGDEFIIMIPGLGSRESLKFAERLFSSFGKKVFAGKPNLSLTLSGGIAVYPRDSENLEKLIGKADKRLYIAKKNGRNQYCIKDHEEQGKREVLSKSSIPVGREKPFQQMIEYLEAALEGSNKVVVVRGESGVGKTFLCNRFLDYVHIRKVVVKIIDFDKTGYKNGFVKSGKLSGGFSKSNSYQMIFIDNFRENAENISTVKDLFRRSIPLSLLILIVVRKIGWGDARILEKNIEEYVDVMTLKIKPFCKKEFNILVKSFLGGIRVDKELLGFLYSKTEGNALLCEELLKVLISKGMIGKINGEYKLKISERQEILPENLLGLLADMTQGLTREESAILSTASIIGKRFNMDTLKAVKNIDLESVLQLLKSPLEYKLIVDNGNGEFTFRLFFHDFFRTRLQSTERKVLHKKVAAILNERGVENLQQQIFYHYTLAGMRQKAISTAMNICEQGIKLGYFPDAEKYADYLIRNTETESSKYANIVSTAAKAYEIAGKFPEAIKLHKEMIKICPGEKLDSSLRLSELYRKTGRYELAIDLLLSLGLQGKASSCRILNQIADTLMQMGKLDKALEYVKKSIDLSKRYMNKEEEATGYYITGGIFWFKGEYELGENMMFKAIKLFKREMKEAQVGLAMNRLGIIKWSQGRLKDAQKYISEAVQIFKKSGKINEENRTYTNLGIISESLGRWDEAETYYRKGIEMALAKNLSSLLGRNYDNIGTLLLKQGFYEESLGFFRKAVKLRLKSGGRIELATTYHNIGTCHMFYGNYKTSGYFLKRAGKIFDETNAVGMKIDNVNTLFELSIFRKELNKAKEYLESLEKLVDSNGTDFQKSQYYRVKAKYLRKKKKFDDSRKFAEMSIEMLNENEERYELGKSILELCLTLYREGNLKKAMRELVKSRAIFSELGARKAREKVDMIMKRMKRRSETNAVL